MIREAATVETGKQYPEGVSRLPTGRIRPVGSPQEAFEREAWEETGLAASMECKIGLARCAW